MFHALTGGEVGKRIGWGGRKKDKTRLWDRGGDGRGRREEEGTYGIVCVCARPVSPSGATLSSSYLATDADDLKIKGDVVVKLKCGRRRGTKESEMIYARKIEEGEIDENLGRSLASLSIMCRGNE